MIRTIALVYVIISGGVCYGFQQKGSVEAYRQAAANDRAAARAAQAWNSATKITVLDKTPAEPRFGARELGDLKTGYVGYVEEWEFEVLSIINANEMILSSHKGLICLADYPTKDFVDDQVCRIVGPIRCGETKSYTTVDDKATVRVVRLVPASEVQEMEKKAAEAEEAKLYRTFTDASGKFTFEGKFIEYKNQIAVFAER
jgi:hypothetical protein